MNGQVNTLGTKKNTYNNISRPKKNRHLQKKKDLQRGKKCNLKRTTFLFEVLCYQYRQRIDPAQSAEPWWNPIDWTSSITKYIIFLLQWRAFRSMQLLQPFHRHLVSRTFQPSNAHIRWMRDVDTKSVDQLTEFVAAVSQMLDPLHFIVPVVVECFVE